MITDQQAEEIVLLAALAGIKERDAAPLVLEKYGMRGVELDPWELTLKIVNAKMRLTEQLKEAHSQHTNKSEE